MNKTIYAPISKTKTEQSATPGWIVLRWWRAIFAVLLAGVMALPAMAAESLVIDVDSGNPPFMYKRNGEEVAQGIYPAVLKAIFERLAIPVSIQAVPWKRALLDIDRGVAGVGGIYKNEVRLLKYDYSDPLFVERIAVYYNKSNPIKFNTIEDLYGKRVGVILGWSYGDDFDLARTYEQILVEPTNSDEQNFDKLSRGRIDAVLAIVESGDRLLAHGKRKDVVMAKTLFLANPAHLAFLKKTNQLPLIQRFNKELAEMKKDGTLESMVQQELAR